MKSLSLASGVRAFLLLILATLAIEFTMPESADARAGGSRSMGRSSRPAPSQQYNRPSSPPPQYNQPAQAPRGGGFMRGLAGGVAGGFLGSMLFSSMGHAAPGGGMGGGGGLGLIEIILIAGLAYLAFRWWKNRQTQMKLNTAGQTGAGFGAAYPMDRSTPSPVQTSYPPYADTPQSPVIAGPGISNDEASDIFFKVQGAFTRRDLSSVAEVIGPEVYQGLNQDLRDLRDKKQINRLENISVRKVETIESWVEGTSELARVRFTANLLDYTVDETTQNVISGSATDPVKFEEEWLFCRATPYAAWQLVGIQQV